MLLYEKQKNEVYSSNNAKYNLEIRDTFIALERRHGAVLKQGAILYEPVVKNKKSKIGIIIMHSDSDYSAFPMCSEMARRGYITLGSHVKAEDITLDEKLLDVHTAVSFLRNYPGIEKIVLMGHSGGATLMSAYKAIAENGPKIFQGDHMLFSCTLKNPLADADGIMLLDSNWGNGAMTLFSIDPAVVEEGDGIRLNPEFDIYSPENGYHPDGAHYSDKFIQKYLLAQKNRNNALIEKAVERLHALEQGKGFYHDDEPFIITGGALSLPCNKLFPQDLRLFAHTKEKYTLLHKDSIKSFEIISSVRRPEKFGNNTSVNREGTLITTVRQFLSERSVLAGENYHIGADGVTGVEWDRSYNCTPANVKHIHDPILCMGMTGSHEFLAAEEIYHNAGSHDKEIAFVKGADHMFRAIDDKYGDTEKIVYDSVDKWLSKPGRFFD